MTKDTQLMLIRSTLAADKSADGKPHALQMVLPFPTKPKNIGDLGKLIAQLAADLDEVAKTKKVVGTLRDETGDVAVDTAIKTSPLSNGETGLDVVWASLARGFALQYQPAMGKALKAAFGKPEPEGSTTKKASGKFDPKALF